MFANSLADLLIRMKKLFAYSAMSGTFILAANVPLVGRRRKI